jgi:cholinesterase
MPCRRPYDLAALVAILCALMVPRPASAAVINDLFVFGDSYSDTGAYVKPTTNGNTAVAYLAKDFGITLTTSKNPDPGTDGVNFAEAGARVFVGPKPPAQPRSLTRQVAEFRNYVAAHKVRFDPHTSLFLLLGGLNDHNFVTSAQVNAATLAQVTTLHDLGARLFEIALLPSKVPVFTDSANNLNAGYRALVPKLRAEFPDAVFGLSNWGPDYDSIIEYPSKYGMTNVTDPCRDFHASTPICSTPGAYFYYFNDHPSDAAHHIVGNELYAEVPRLPSVPPPPRPRLGQ